MTMNKKWLAVAMMVPLAFGSTAVLANGKKGGDKGAKECSGQMHGKNEFRGLNLTDAQKTELKTIRDEVRASKKAQGESKRQQMKAMKDQEQQLVLAADFDEAKAKELASSMVAERTAMKVEKMRTTHRMMSVLTAEQKQQLVEKRAEKAQKCEQKMQKKMEKKMAKKDNQ
ncbi:Spy/CpxP family protein refolding chaperone [Vibrio neonatus]|uniref:Spy/CpxP family protein refolding chaperone n=1 Tax=Vibrio neonatus TaxID=278860 RepID=UPI0021C4BD75|nr:Spy/CpxP family protein refolding chaperone [Vibrio neonatus]